MGHPELNSDESIILATQNVVVKSVPFEAILTNERLILVNSRDTLMPPQYLPLAAILNLDTGENAIRDPTITLSVGTETGSTRQMVLTFSRQVGGERKRECDEWVKILREKMSSYRERSVSAAAPAAEPDHAHQYGAPSPAGIASGTTGKKKIELARPMKKIIETVHAPQKPVETTTLPQGSFCSRCGSRVPPDSAFCNRCGTRVDTPVVRPGTEPASVPESSVPQVSVPLPPVINPMATHKDRPIEDVIHSIEPLIEDSKPRTQPSPLVPSRHPTQSTAAPTEKAPVQAPAAPVEATETDQVQKNLAMFSNILVQKPEGEVPAVPPAAGAAEAVTASPESIAVPAQEATTVPPPLPPAEKRSSKKPLFIAAGIIVVIIIAVVLGATIFMKGGAGPSVPLATPTPEITAAATPLPTTVIPTQTPTPVPTVIVATPPPTPAPLAIPTNGVWVRVKYAGQFTGSYGPPGALHEVTGTGEQVYQIPTSTGVVVSSFSKNDGSGDLIATAIYKDGVLIKSDSTSTPNGIAQIQVDLKAAEPTTEPTQAPVTNTTTATP